MGSYSGLLALCETIITAVRMYTIAHESLDNIEPYTKDPDVENWPLKREWKDSHKVLAEKFRGRDPASISKNLAHFPAKLGWWLLA